MKKEGKKLQRTLNEKQNSIIQKSFLKGWINYFLEQWSSNEVSRPFCGSPYIWKRSQLLYWRIFSPNRYFSIKQGHNTSLQHSMANFYRKFPQLRCTELQLKQSWLACICIWKGLLMSKTRGWLWAHERSEGV